MIRAGALFHRIYAYENLARAARRAQRGKRYRPDVLRFNHRLEDELHRLGRELRGGSWRPGEHDHFQVHEPKVRWISAAPYPDRVVHHALCNVIEPVLDRRLIHDCWANRVGKGTHRAVLRYQAFAQRHAFALKMDVRKYFPSVDHALLKRQLRRVFKEPETLALMDVIIDNGTVPEPHHAYYPGDDLFAPYERAKGLPIGNLTSQLWANTYLNGFDHWVQETLRAPAYLRFVDDFVLLHDSKDTLLEWAEAVARQLRNVRLALHASKCVVRRTAEGVPFLGYVVWPHRIRVRGATVRRFRKRHRRLAARDPVTAADGLIAWQGHVGLAGTWRRRGGLS